MTEALENKFVEKLASNKGISLAEASDQIQKCIVQTSKLLKRPEKEVYAFIHSREYLKGCLRKQGCDEIDIKECEKSCFCIVYGKKCIDRRISDAPLINKDPDKYAQNLSTDELKKLVEHASYLYYNYEGGGLTDNSFDALEYQLKKRLRLKKRLYEKVGAPPVDKIRTKLPFPMPSLTKFYPTSRSLIDFIEQNEPLVYSLKLDGVSGMIVYKNGRVSGIYTRGNGLIGGDVTYLQDYVQRIPEAVSRDYVVRGEFVMSKKVFDKKYSEIYSNPRSLVSAKINSGYISPALKDINFVVYDILKIDDEKEVPPILDALTALQEEDFEVVKHSSQKDITIFGLMQLYKKERETAVHKKEYPIDGLVISGNHKRPAIVKSSEVTNPTDMYAFKMKLESQKRETKVINVEWNISRYGRYVPVVIYEAVYIDGVRLHRATGHNARWISERHIGSGTGITVIRSGDVIPAIIDVDIDTSISPIIPLTPDEDPDNPDIFGWHWKGANIILDDIEGNKYVQIKRAHHFFSTLQVPRLGEKTIEKLWEAGHKTPESIARLSSTDFQKIRGIGKKTGDLFATSIKEKLETTPLDRYLIASSKTNIGLGRVLIKKLFREMPAVFEMDEKQIRKAFTKKKIPGFGPKRIDNVAKGMPKFREYLYSFAKDEIERAIKKFASERKTRKLNPKIKGNAFVLSGFMGKTDYELEDYIYDHHGDISSVVSRNTAAVISGNLGELSKKMLKAYELGVPVLTVKEFAHKFNVPLKRFEEATTQ